MKSMKHKNIIQFYGYYQDADENYLIIMGLYNIKHLSIHYYVIGRAG